MQCFYPMSPEHKLTGAKEIKALHKHTQTTTWLVITRSSPRILLTISYEKSYRFTKSYSLHIPLTLHQKYNENCSRQSQTSWPFYFTKKVKCGDTWQAWKFDLGFEQEIQNEEYKYVKLYRTLDFSEKHYKTSCFRTAHYLVQVFTFLY